MFKPILLFVCICVTSGQWMPFMDGHHISPFADSIADPLLGSKDSTTKIPIIVLLKPKRAKSMSEDTSDDKSDDRFSIGDWMKKEIMGVKRQEAHDSEQEPDSEASEGDQVTVKGRGGDQIKWSALKAKKNGLTPEQLASVSQLFPKFAAMSQPNTDLSELANKNSFEDALKKFTSNLTDFEHRKNEDKDKDANEQEDNGENGEENSDIEGMSNKDVLKSVSTETIDSDDKNQKSQTLIAEERGTHQSLRPQKTSPFLSDRHRTKVPFKTEANEANTQTIVGRPSNKGWVPIRNKSRPKHKTSHKPMEKNEIHLPVDPPSALFHPDRRPFGMPDLYHSTSTEMPHMFEARPFPHSYIPFDSHHHNRHFAFHKYSPYLTETELSPTMMSMDMMSDANKPQHMAPAKESLVEAGNKVKDVIDQKEHLVDKHYDDKTALIDQKEMIIEEKPTIGGMGGMGEEILSQHMTCCDMLHGHHHGPGDGQVIHEEVIEGVKPEFIDDKFMKYPQHFGPNFEHSLGPKKDCVHPFGHSYQQPFYWPPHSYRRPIFRPKFFYKPLFFG